MYVNVQNSGLELCQLMPAKIDALAKKHFYDLLYIALLYDFYPSVPENHRNAL